MQNNKSHILKRSLERRRKITILQTNLHNDDEQSLTPHLLPLEAWELTSKISRELYYLQTGQRPDVSVVRTVINVVQR